MSFKVAARTILELGAELISSDGIALYELIKNAYDARSKRATITVRSTLKYSELRNALGRIAVAERELGPTATRNAEARTVDTLRTELYGRLDADVTQSDREDFLRRLARATTLARLRSELNEAYEELNVIEVSDTGEGMSLETLNDVFLTIGTTSRLNRTEHYTGGKGIGRLSAMRLGDILEVSTSTAGEPNFNLLEIDWRDVAAAAGKDLAALQVSASRGSRKNDAKTQGTRIRIRNLKADWDRERMKRLAERYFSRLFDPFSGRARYPLRIFVNEQSIDIPTFDAEILVEAMAKANITYSFQDGKPRLALEIDYMAKGSTKVDVWSMDDILGLTSKEDLSVEALTSLGPFKASFHWFNRQRIKAIDGFGDRDKVKDTVNSWANGLMMYRDGFRVNPYGNPDDDWLGIDVKAFGSSGYKVNRKQLIGAVYITAKENPYLIDQTNREGLRSNEEKSLLILLLQTAITEKFKSFLNQVEKQARNAEKVSAAETTAYLEGVDKKIRNTFKNLAVSIPKERRDDVEFVEATFQELHDRLDSARSTVAIAEREQRELVDLAGIGLQVEIVAHELNRITRRTLSLIAGLDRDDFDARQNATFDSIESQMLVIRKRLDVLDPLGPNSRNRKEAVDLKGLVEMLLASHEDQFERYGIKGQLRMHPPNAKSFNIKAVKGMIVQVIENLIDNSVFWLKQRRRLDPGFAGSIVVDVDVAGSEIRITDNGPGVPVNRAEEIFLPFVSFKPPGEGKGLGLYISREIAKRHSSDLYLLAEPNEEGRLHTFVLDING